MATKTILLGFFIFSFLASAGLVFADASNTKVPASGVSLPESKNDDMIGFANHSKIVSTTEVGQSTVKIIQVSKCEGCANDFDKIYVAIGYADLGEVLYETYPANEWTFLRVVSFPTDGGNLAFKEGFFVFEAEAWRVHLKNGKIIERGKFEIGVNLDKAYIKQIK